MKFRYLGDRDPDEAEPPEVEGEEEGAEDVAQRAGQHVPEYVLHGVSCMQRDGGRYIHFDLTFNFGRRYGHG